VNQAVAFGLLFAGGVLVTAGFSRRSLGDVLTGKPGKPLDQSAFSVAGVGAAASDVAGTALGAANSLLAPNLPAGSVVSPIPKRQSLSWSRIDQGQDVETTGHGVYNAMASGTVTYGSNPGGWGIQFPILRLDKPLKLGGITVHSIFYGHLKPLVAEGTHVSAGQPIGGAGHAEIGPWPGPVWGSAATRALSALIHQAPRV
jgi:murein DD-endopeptidase MepM/ murein hydrolase activator NlpD